jgi:hypothetical protein
MIVDPNAVGTATYHTRVERWECDYNDHWNVQFYGRSFQMAAEAIAVRATGANPGADATRTRHLRFHGELTVSAPIEVRSARLADADHLEEATVHLLFSAGRIAATALDLPGGALHLPRVRRPSLSCCPATGFRRLRLAVRISSLAVLQKLTSLRLASGDVRLRSREGPGG